MKTPNRTFKPNLINAFSQFRQCLKYINITQSFIASPLQSQCGLKLKEGQSINCLMISSLTHSHKDIKHKSTNDKISMHCINLHNKVVETHLFSCTCICFVIDCSLYLSVHSLTVCHSLLTSSSHGNEADWRNPATFRSFLYPQGNWVR